MTNGKIDENLPCNLNQSLEEAKNQLHHIQDQYIKEAAAASFTCESLQNIQENLNSLIQNAGLTKETYPILRRAIHQVRLINAEVSKIYSKNESHLRSMERVANTTYTFSTTAGSATSSFLCPFINPPVPPSLISSKYCEPKLVLERIDPSLADTYNEVEQAYYSTNADNLRTAAMVLRQAFDHFFTALAPDEKVRKSKFWKPKKNEKDKDLVTRKERIKYAISTHVKSNFKAATLVDNLDIVIESYNQLNRLHTRGRIDMKSVKQALFAIKRFLEDFAISINDPGSISK